MTQKAKKWLFGIFVAAVLVAGACLVIDKVTRDDQAKIFTEYIAEDYDYAMSQADSTANVFVYEYHCTLSKAISDRNDNKPLDVLEYEMVYRKRDTVYFRTRNVETGEVSETQVPGLWVGSADIRDIHFPINYLTARNRLYKANLVLPDGDKMVIRQPLTPKWKEPLYIFGTLGTGFVYVDAITGKVATLSDAYGPDENVDFTDGAVAPADSTEVAVDTLAVE